ncbi:MAG TPA: chemotaxis protein CheD [Candidatus Methanoperedens sp.]|nr:chemotaxis protein CheD [Candidatus Methanoperedens sp.]
MDPNPEKIIIGIAELVVVHNPAILITIGLGSCVAISIRDPVARFGGLSHILLPSISESNNKSNRMKFADSAIEMLVDMLLQKGCLKSRLEAKIAGGASMFNISGNTINMGERNTEAVKKKLKELKIPLLASDTGANYGRTIEFNISSGIMYVKSAFHGIKEI